MRITEVTNAEKPVFAGFSPGHPAAAGGGIRTDPDTIKKGQARATYSSGAIDEFFAGNQRMIRLEAAAEYRALDRLRHRLTIRHRFARSVVILALLVAFWYLAPYLEL